MFQGGITPDFYIDAKGRFEQPVAHKLDGVPGLSYSAMPDQPGKIAAPGALNQLDAVFALSLRFTRESLVGVERLAVIARWGVGYDMIDVAALTERDIALAITPNAVRVPVAESIFAFIFALSKNLLEQDRITRAGQWRPSLSRLGTCLPGRTLGSVGCGNIGREMFRLAAPFGFKRLIAHDPHCAPALARSVGVDLVSIEEVFADSDFVAINCLLNDETRGIVNESLLRRMKPTAFLINTARGPIVDQKALTRALAERWFLGAGLDVFEQEPIDPSDPLLKLDNVVLAPHALAWTEEIARDNGLEACDNILAVFRGEPPPGIVNREVLNRKGFQDKLARYGRKA